MHGVERDAVVPPAATAREGVDRQQLDQVDPELDEVVKAFDHAVEGALGTERPDVQLVDHAAVQRQPAPTLVGPGEGAVVDHPARPVDAGRLPERARVRQRVAAVEHERIVLAGGRAGRGAPPAAGSLLKGLALAAGLDLHARRQWGPHLKIP